MGYRVAVLEIVVVGIASSIGFLGSQRIVHAATITVNSNSSVVAVDALRKPFYSFEASQRVTCSGKSV